MSEEMRFSEVVEKAEQSMRESDYGIALSCYQEAWTLSGENSGITERVWLLLALATAAVRLGDYDEAYEAIYGLFNGFADTGIVVGNPYFHLIAGLAFHGLGDADKSETDNFARTLICGGPEMFNGEDPEFLERMKQLLKPPAELGTWDGYKGCSRDLLNGASGYVREVIAEKIGSPPPYTYEN
jgi:hypothetical protein